MEALANIFNIQKFSIHDGPGIRTTVFFKGCPLRCKWCSNPESQEYNTLISYDRRLCLSCRRCEAACPCGAVSFSPETGTGINRSLCDGCLSCVKVCPVKALKAEGELRTVDEVIDICLQDLDFYEESGGGVTLSGGECLCQPEFVAKLIAGLHGRKIHVAAETTGYIAPEVFKNTAPLFDLLLFDVKHYDPEKHFEGTGVRNDLIIQNLKWAAEERLNILPRIPVIPGFNSALKDAEGISELIISVGLSRAQLLPFHQFGERKYELLSRNYTMKDVKALQKEELEDYRRVFTDKGLDCFF